MASQFTAGRFQYLADDGSFAVGYRLYTYESGTTTHKNVYTSSALNVVATYTSDGVGGQYIALNSRGEAQIWPAEDGPYTFVVKTAAGVTVETTDGWMTADAAGSAAAVVTRLASTSSASDGAGMEGYGYDQAYAARTVGGRLRDLGVFASDIPGYDPTGVADSTAAINTAYSAAVARGLYTVYITGTPKVSGATPFPFTERLSFVGVGGGEDVFTNDLSQYPVRMLCGGVTGYLFSQPDVADGSGALTLRNIAFDGTVAGGTGRSTTWTGLVQSAAANSNFYLRIVNCAAGNSDSTDAILGLTGQVFGHVENSYFVLWPLGYGFRAGGAGIATTTLTFEKCYFTNMRQIYEVTSNVSDVTLNGCVYESSVVAGAAIASRVVENDCYYENMGYDASVTGLTTGLTARSFGVADAPAIAGNVTAVFTARYGQIVQNAPTFRNTVGGKKWFDGIGRSSGIGSSGAIVVNDATFASGSPTNVFTADADTPSSRNDFEYHMTMVRGSATYMTAADARMLTKGRVPIKWSDTNVRPVEVENGIFTIPALAVGGLTALPTIYPDGGTNAIGDVIRMATSQYREGVRSAYQCVTAGSTGSRWTICDFIPCSLTASVAAAGTMVLTARSVDNPGELHVWEVMASTGANVNSHYRVSMQAFTGAGQLSVESIVTTNTLTFTMGWGNPYTITVTNTSGATLNIYARLVSVSSTHAA